MADPKIEAKKIAMAAAQGVAIALSNRGDTGAVIPPRIICGMPTFLYDAVLEADAAGNVTVRSVTEHRGA